MTTTATSTITGEQFKHQALIALGQHGMFTLDQLCRLIPNTPPMGSLRRTMRRLESQKMVASITRDSTRRKTWFLTAAGVDAMKPVLPEPMRMSPLIATGPTSAHLDGTNEVGLAAIKAVGADQVSWNHEEALPLGSSKWIRPDAVLTATVVDGPTLRGGQWFVEFDRGTEAIGVLADKVANYLTYRSYRPNTMAKNNNTDLHWKQRFREWPTIMFVFEGHRAERRIEDLAAWIETDPRLTGRLSKLPIIATPHTHIAHAFTDPRGFVTLPHLDPRPWINP